MKKFSLLSLCMMACLLLFTIGCEKEEDSISNNNIEDAYFSKAWHGPTLSNKINSVSSRQKQSEIDNLVNKVYEHYVSTNFKNKALLESRYGFPIWNLTEFVPFGDNIVTITPVYKSEFGLITNFILTNSKNKGVEMMAKKATLKEDFLVLQTYFNNIITGTGNDIQLKGTNDGVTIFGPTGQPFSLDCVDVVDITTNYNIEIIYNTSLGTNTIYSGGDIIAMGGGSYNDDNEVTAGDDFYAWPTGGDIGISGYSVETWQDCVDGGDVANNDPSSYASNAGGGGSGWASSTNTFDKCMEYYKNLGGVINMDGTEGMRKMIYDNCGGCKKAAYISNSVIKMWMNTSSDKLRCHLCKLEIGELMTQETLLEAWPSIEFPCDDIDKDQLLDELLPECDFFKNDNLPLTWTVFNQKMTGTPWIKPEGWFKKVSAEVSSMGILLGLSPLQVLKLDDESLCTKINLSKCLQPAIAGGPSNPEEEANKAQLLDFFKNSSLIDPCTGDALDLDKIMSELCDSDDVSMNGLNEAFALLADDLIKCTATNPCEDLLIKANPIAAFRIYANSTHATRITIEKFGYNGWLDCTDAFRHTLFNALNTIDVGQDITKKFSDAHECDESGMPGSGNDVEMDLHNNNEGIKVGNNYPNVSIEVIIDRVCDRLEAGLLKISSGANQSPPNPQATLINSNECKCN